MNRTKKRPWIGALLGTLVSGLLFVVPTPAHAETGAQASCANAGDATAVMLCMIRYNADYAAEMALPAHATITDADSTADAQAWAAATGMNTPTAYAAYTAGWQSGVGYIDGTISGDRAFLTDDCPYEPTADDRASCFAFFQWWLSVDTSARPTAVSNAQVASNRVGEVYATFTPRSDGVDVVFKYGGTVVSNGIVDGKAQVTISVDGNQFTWRDGTGGFTVFVTPPYPTPTPTPSPTPTPTPTPTSKVFARAYTPTISGSTKVGKVLKTKVKAWSPKAAFAYQWLRSGSAIPGATKSSYKLTSADYKAKISVRVTGTRSGYTAVVKASKATKAIKAGTMPKGKVKVTGTTKVGSTVTAKTYKWSSGVVFTYRWYRNGKRISGATAQTYTLTALDKGKRIKVKVVANKLGCNARTKTSKSTSKIKAGPVVKPTPAPTPAPSPAPSPAPTTPAAPVAPPTPTAMPTS